MNFAKYKAGRLTLKPSFYKIPVTRFNTDNEGMNEFNDILHFLQKSDYNKIIRTPSGGISQKTIYPAWDLQHSNIVAELTVINEFGMYRFQFRNVKMSNNTTGISGAQAFKKFKNVLKKYNIDINTYKITNGKEVKETIEKPYIQLYRESFKDVIFHNCHHIDFHNSYPAGLVNTHPEFKEAIEYCYERRKTNAEYKAILNLSIGYFQQNQRPYWAHLSKDAIHDNNIRLKELSDRLIANGNTVLLYNTDGIWYTGEIYHGAGEGDKLGQWHNDHINTIWRAKSAGAYEFIEDGVYHPVLRGRTLLDDVKPRTEWSWGDIYNKDCTIIKYALTDNGILEVINEE